MAPVVLVMMAQAAAQQRVLLAQRGKVAVALVKPLLGQQAALALRGHSTRPR